MDFSNTSTAQVEKEEWTNYNGGTDPFTCSVSFSDATYQRVTGSPETGPAWTSKFTPLSNTTYPVNYYENPVTINPGKRLTYYLKYSSETGTEQWSGGNPPVVVSRDRRWDSPHVVISRVTNYP